MYLYDILHTVVVPPGVNRCDIKYSTNMITRWQHMHHSPNSITIIINNIISIS